MLREEHGDAGKTDRRYETDRQRETPAVASPAVIIVLTLKWKALTIGAG